MVRSIPGVNGGYGLAKSAEEISFWHVVEAVEGTAPFFQCAEIRRNELLLDKEDLPDSYTKCPCLIKVVMSEAEDQMRQYLLTKTLGWLWREVKEKVPEDHQAATVEWFRQSGNRTKKSPSI